MSSYICCKISELSHVLFNILLQNHALAFRIKHQNQPKFKRMSFRSYLKFNTKCVWKLFCRSSRIGSQSAFRLLVDRKTNLIFKNFIFGLFFVLKLSHNPFCAHRGILLNVSLYLYRRSCGLWLSFRTKNRPNKKILKIQSVFLSTKRRIALCAPILVDLQNNFHTPVLLTM